MGIFLNPGNAKFQEARAGKVYVDKSAMIQCTNEVLKTPQKYVCVSRPRRFGKSMALGMLEAYYSRGCNSEDLFRGLKISRCEDYEKHRNRYHVISLNMQQFLSLMNDVDSLLAYLQKKLLKELKAYFTFLEEEDFLSIAFQEIFSVTGEAFIFLIDEWDCILRENQFAEEEHRKYLDFLRNLFKDQSYAALVYMTGILPIKKYGTHSAINMFRELSMLHPEEYAEYAGFTEAEVEELCQVWNADYTKMKLWYDGYELKGGLHIYNPKSVVDSIHSHSFNSYWTRTETYEALRIYMDMDFDGLKSSIIQMISGDSVKLNPNRFQNDMKTFRSKDDVLTLLIHLGYLSYREEDQTVRIPNYEVRQEFLNAVEGSHWNGVIRALNQSKQLLLNTYSQDADKVAEMIQSCHEENTSILTYNDENSLSCVISLAYYYAMDEYNRIRELPSGKGFADIVFLPKKASDKPALLVELKVDRTAETAINQIKEKGYCHSLKGFAGKVLLVGINYDKKTKKHSCKIESLDLD